VLLIINKTSLKRKSTLKKYNINDHYQHHVKTNVALMQGGSKEAQTIFKCGSSVHTVIFKNNNNELLLWYVT